MKDETKTKELWREFESDDLVGMGVSCRICVDEDGMPDPGTVLKLRLDTKSEGTFVFELTVSEAVDTVKALAKVLIDIRQAVKPEE